MDPNNQQTPPVNPGPAPMVTPPSTPSPQFGTPPPASVPASGGKKNMLIWIIIAAVIVVAGVAYGVYAYISNTPENLMKSAVQNLSNEKTAAATFTIVNGTGDDKVTLTGDLAVKADESNNKNGEVIVGLGADSSRVSLSALSLDGTMYLKLAHAENLGALLSSFSTSESALSSEDFMTALENVNDKWFEITKDQVQAIAESSGNNSVAASPTPEDLKKTLEIYNQHAFIKPDKTYADEVVDGSNSAHFSVKIDKNEQVAFLQALKAANLATIKVTDSDIDQIKNSSAPTNITLDLWIARDSHKFKQLRLANTNPGEEMTMTVTLKNQLPTFDAFQKPSPTYPISDFYTLLLGSSS